MLTVRSLIFSFLLVAGLLLNKGIATAQWALVDSLMTTGAIELDTSAYVPYFYRGASDYNLMIAASQGYTSEIERLIKRGAEIDSKTDEGVTPLIFAVSNNHLAAVKVLLYYQPKLDAVTNRFETPLLISVKNRNFEITEALIRAGADMDYSDRYGAAPLHYAAAYGFFDIVDLLLYYNPDIESRTDEGMTPLLTSVWAGYPGVADLLIQNGANIEARDNDGFTPFLMASFFGDTLIMDLLNKHSADIYAKNKSNHNALTLTIMRNQKEATEMLFRMGKRWDEGTDVVSPYSVASKYRRKDLLEILDKNGVQGHIRYEIDQLAFSVSSRFTLYDFYSGFSFSFKEPYINAGIKFGLDTKLWYSRVLLKNGEHLYYQYMDKGNIAYAGLFKDFMLLESPDKFSSYLSTSLLAGYSFGTKLKGTLNVPDNRFIVIPSVSFKFTKMNLTFDAGIDYIKSPYHYGGPIWIRLGCSYNYFFDNVRTRVKDLKWYK